MKNFICQSRLAAIVAIPLGMLVSGHLFAQTCQSFLLGMAPLAKVHYISAADSEGDRLVVGEWNPALGEVWCDIPYPSFFY